MKTKAWNLALGIIAIALAVVPALVEILGSKRETRWATGLDAICTLAVFVYVVGRIYRRKMWRTSLAVVIGIAISLVIGQAFTRHQTIGEWFGGLLGLLVGVAIMELFGIFEYLERIQKRRTRSIAANAS